MQQRTPQEQVALPGDVVTSPGQLPDVCVKHGRPAAQRVDFAMQSRTRISGSRALSGNVLSTGNRLGQWAQQVRITHVRGWPLCRRCALRRAVLMTLSNVLFWGGLVLLAGSILGAILLEPGQGKQTLLAPALLGFGLPLVAVVPFVAGSLPRLTHARTSSDGESVLIESPHPAFAEQITEHDDPRR